MIESRQRDLNTSLSAATVVITVAVLGLIWVCAQFSSAAQLRLMTEFLIFTTLALNWNLLAGYTGLLSVGQQAFVGLGAYSFYVFVAKLNFPVLISVALGAAFCGAVALLAFPLLMRLRGPHFAIGSWVFAELCLLSVANSEWLGAGAGIGFPIVIARELGATRFAREMFTFSITLVLFAACLIGTYLLLRSKIGLGLMAIRDNEHAAERLGVNAAMLKFGVFLATAVATGAAGGVLFLFKLRMTPESAFSLIDWTAYVIFIVVVGGKGRLEGPILGAILFFTLRVLLDDYGAAYLILLGLMAISVMMRFPEGLAGALVRLGCPPLFQVQRLAKTEPRPQSID